MICEKEILPINGFPKKKTAINKNCIKQWHFFSVKIRWSQKK